MWKASQNIATANWLINRLHPVQTGGVGSIIPPGFDAYIRILHPIEGFNLTRLRWSDITTWSGRIYHPGMQFDAIAKPIVDKDLPWGNVQPMSELPIDQMDILSEHLIPFTKTPNQIWFCVWKGYGITMSDNDYHRMPDVQRELDSNYRNYILFEGTNNKSVIDFSNSYGIQPDFWWPSDKSWCVATDTDIPWTYVGGPKDCISALLSHPKLEALPVQLNDDFTIGGDLINR